MSMFKVEWIDGKRAPTSPPDPAFPDGIDIDLSAGRKLTCTVPLVCPAPRCGVYLIQCKTCGLKAVITTAGRPDDPRSVVLACKIAGTA